MSPHIGHIVKKSTNKKCQRECWAKGTILHSWCEYYWYSHYGEQLGGSLKNKINIELQYNPEIPILAIHPEKMKTLIKKDTYTLIFIAALFTIVKTWKQSQCQLTHEWIKKIWYIYIYSHFIHKKNEIMSFTATWMDLKIIILSQESHFKNTNIIRGHLYVESKKWYKWTYLSHRNSSQT